MGYDRDIVILVPLTYDVQTSEPVLPTEEVIPHVPVPPLHLLSVLTRFTPSSPSPTRTETGLPLPGQRWNPTQSCVHSYEGPRYPRSRAGDLLSERRRSVDGSLSRNRDVSTQGT